MTPTLIGRWQTRLFLLATVGVLLTLFFAFGIISPAANSIYFRILAYVAVLGLGWDILYNFLQKLRWDHDWPGLFQLLAGIWEAVFILILVKTLGLPGISSEELLVGWFIFHYSCVWLGVYIASQSLMRILFPRWRFRGGKWL